MEKKTDTLRVAVALTVDQHDKLKKAAQEAGLTLSSFLRMLALERVRND
jgi:uncharacterized protein (DUF1778 family)